MRRKRSNVLLALASLMAAVLVTGHASTAHAVLAAVSTNPDGSFLVHPGNGFPQWYQDTTGVALMQCNFGVPGRTPGFVNDPNCLGAGASANPLPNLPFDEAFYWTADTDAGALDGGSVSGALLVLALEAAFATGDPSPGQQMVFSRIRFRADVTVPGTYTLTHPFGVNTYDVPVILPGAPEINDTVDIGLAPLVFSGALGGGIGPFLTCVSPAPPAGYLGNAGVPCTFTGGVNDFANITGPGTNNTTTQLLIGGKIDTGVPIPPLTVDGASYRCDRAGACVIDVFAHSGVGAVLSAEAGGFTGAMTGDGAGGFFGSFAIPLGLIPFPIDRITNPPLLVNVSAAQPPNIPVVKQMPLVDSVTISQATHNVATGIVTVRAASGDLRATLTEAQLGRLTGGVLNTDINGFFPVSIPRSSVTVVSNAGGTATSATQIINVPEVLKVTGAVFNARLRRVTVTGTSTAHGATIALGSSTTPLGTGIVNARGGFKVTMRANRKPRRVLVISSGGKSVRAAVR